MAFTKANQQILEVSSRPITSGIPSLRPIMSRHHKLRKACSVLNQAYGLAMFFATSIVLVEVTVSVFVVILISKYGVDIPWHSMVWSFVFAIPIGAVMKLSQDVENLVIFLKLTQTAELDGNILIYFLQSIETRIFARKLKAFRFSPFSTPELRAEVWGKSAIAFL